MRAKLTIELTGPDGAVLAARSASNSVMQAGAQLIAQLFSGAGGPITHMGVGINDAPETDAFSTAALTNTAGGGNEPLQGPVEAAITPDAFQIEPDQTHRVVRVRVRGTIPANGAVGTVREAGLVSRTGDTAVLYNRVTFAPITKGNDHELTLFWEINFPYGDLQGVF
jgi:hypothetical protein